jgi:hypothetical protein
MLIIDSTASMDRALKGPLTGVIKRVLALRRDQLSGFEGYDLGDLGRWLIVEPGDTISAIETAAGLPIAVCHADGNEDDALEHGPPWEWVLDHGGLYEAPIILTDDGFGTVLIVSDRADIEPTLLNMLRREAVASSEASKALPS